MKRAIAPSLATLTAIALLSGCSMLGGSPVQVFSVGQCVNIPDSAEEGDQEVGALPIVDCADPHSGEVFYVEEMTDSTYPADTPTIADEICVAAFEGYVGIPYADSVLYGRSLYPTSATWEDGDRQIACLIVGDVGEELTGSMKDTAQ